MLARCQGAPRLATPFGPWLRIPPLSELIITHPAPPMPHNPTEMLNQAASLMAPVLSTASASNVYEPGTAKSSAVFELKAYPAVRILPSGWSSTSASFSAREKLLMVNPPEPKVGSRRPPDGVVRSSSPP